MCFKPLTHPFSYEFTFILDIPIAGVGLHRRWNGASPRKTICGAGDENDDPVDDDQDADRSAAVADGDASPMWLLMR